MIQFDYESKDLFKENKSYKLSSVYGEDNFFYGLFEDRTDRLMKARFITGLPAGYLNDADFLRDLFRKEKLTGESVLYSAHAVSNPHFTLLPADWRIEDPAKLAGSFSGVEKDNRFEFLIQQVGQAAVQLSYFMPAVLKSVIRESYPNGVLMHLNGALIHTSASFSSQTFLLANWLDRTLQTVVWRGGKLLRSNHYALMGQDDALYYILLNAAEQQLDPLNDSFYITGPIPLDASGPQSLSRHIKFLDPVSDPNRLNFANVFLGKSRHMFYDLQCVLQCES
jgi:hypothetical protein